VIQERKFNIFGGDSIVHFEQILMNLA